jgi:hypothetical protein
MSTMHLSCSVVIFSTYVATCHCMLYQCILECLTCLLLASGRHNLNFLKNEYHIYKWLRQCLEHGFLLGFMPEFGEGKIEI